MKSSGIVLFLFLLFLPVTVYGEWFIGVGTETLVSSDLDPVVLPGIYTDGGFDLFFPVGNRMSFFCDGGGEFSYFPRSSDFSGKAYLTGDASFKTDRFFTKVEAGSYYEQTTWQTSPLWYQHGTVDFSLDFEKTSVFISPSIIWEIEDTDHTVGGEYTAGISTYANQLVITQEASLTTKALPGDNREIAIGPETELSWYPGLPLTLTGAVGFVYTDSSVEYESNSAIYWEPALTLFLMDNLNLDLDLSGSYALMDHGYYDEETETTQEKKEYRLYFTPEATLDFAATKNLDIQFSVFMEMIHSNSAYLNSIIGGMNISASYSF